MSEEQRQIMVVDKWRVEALARAAAIAKLHASVDVQKEAYRALNRRAIRLVNEAIINAI